MTNTDASKTIHQGRNVKRFREMLGIKQEALADKLGEEWSQKKVSTIEGREVIDPATLEELAKALQVPAEAIKNFNEEMAINIISNTFHDQAINMNYQCTFNPFDRVVELYDALLKSEREKVALLEKFLDKK